MEKSKIIELKENKEVKYIYKLPCSFYKTLYEYIIIGNIEIELPNIKVFSLDQWFEKMNNGSIIPYVCATLPKKYKIKEYLNLYQKPDLLKLRTYISQLQNDFDIIQECLFGEQLIKLGKIYQLDVFKNKVLVDEAKQIFYDAIFPIYKYKLDLNI